MTERLSYVVVTPARDENESLMSLAAALAKQTVRPSKWIIVDNSTSGDTAGTAERLAAEHPWIEVKKIPPAAAATRALPIVRAFMAGLEVLGEPPDVVVKLDADVSVDADYFEQLLDTFAAEPELGIASGTCYERDRGTWRERHVTGAHVWGAARAYRWACLQDVLPLEERLGWDGIDALKASLRGWQTKTLRNLPFYHYRREGEREGFRPATWAKAGNAAHYMGYRFGYLLLRTSRQAARDPAAVGLLCGYAAAALRRERRCPDLALRAYVREQQSLRKVPERVRESLGRRAA